MARGTAFTLDNLRLLDFGKIGLAFAREVEHVVKDCLDRPGDDHARTVTLRFSFTPDGTPGVGDCETVRVEAEVSSAVPKRRSKVYEMTPRKSGDLVFNPDLPGEPDAETLFDSDERREDGI